jgi:uncharacterized repeat protein (TIGR02543 family)
MSTTNYSASLITQRNRDKVIAQRIKQDTDAGKPIIVPQAGYGSYLLGEATNGNITYFKRVQGCTDINLSCNCTGSTTVTTSAPAPSPAPVPPSSPYNLTYNRNASQGGTGTAPASIGYSGGTNVTISDNTTFSATGKTFGGWNTSIDGTGTYYPAGSTLTTPYANTILYAQWYSSSGTSYSVIYNGNGNTDGTAPATVSNYKQYQPVSISLNSGTLIKTDFTFNGWNTSANGSGTAYPVTPVLSNGFTMPAANVTLYAQWVDTSTNYTLTYDGQGNTSGSVPAATSYPDGAGVAVAGQVVAKTGYTFLGWSTEPIGASYLSNNSVVMNADKTLYAQWVGGTLRKTCGSGTSQPSGTPPVPLASYNTTNSYYDSTNNTLTVIIPFYYGNTSSGPFNTGLGPTDNSHTGNLLSAYTIAILSKVGGTYKINTTIVTKWTGQTVVQTSTFDMGFGPGSTYWPTTQELSQVTLETNPSTPSAFIFDVSGNPSFSLGNGGCFGGTTKNNADITFGAVLAFYITFNDNPQTTTRVAVGNEFRWTLRGPTDYTQPYTYVNNYARVEVANGRTPSPITGTFPSSGLLTSTGVNTT